MALQAGVFSPSWSHISLDKSSHTLNFGIHGIESLVEVHALEELPDEIVDLLVLGQAIHLTACREQFKLFDNTTSTMSRLVSNNLNG